MKKTCFSVLIVVLIVVLSFSLVACNNDGAKGNTNSEQIEDSNSENNQISVDELKIKLERKGYETELLDDVDYESLNMEFILLAVKGLEEVNIYKYINEQDAIRCEQEMPKEPSYKIIRKDTLVVFGTQQGVRDALY